MKKITLEQVKSILLAGHTVLSRIRKINWKNEKDEVIGYKAELEFMEIIHNPTLGAESPLALLNEGDDRFTSRAQLGWLSTVPETSSKLFGYSLEEFNKLELCNGMKRDERILGKHYLDLNIVDPEIQGKLLKIQVTETTVRKNDREKAKINPSTNEPITFNGQPVFAKKTIVFNKAEHTFLAGDKVPNVRVSVGITEEQLVREAEAVIK